MSSRGGTKKELWEAIHQLQGENIALKDLSSILLQCLDEYHRFFEKINSMPNDAVQSFVRQFNHAINIEKKEKKDETR